jgi:hypothetical protein
MAEHVFLMHNAADDDGSWEPYLETPKATGRFQGGSAIGGGICLRKDGAPRPLTAHLVGCVRVEAVSIDHAKHLLSGNPHFETGGWKYASCHVRVDAGLV